MNESDDYSLVMPFNVVASKGGPYDDAAFVAGWRLAMIREALSHSGAEWFGVVRSGDLPQLDLIAMERGLTVVCNDEGRDEWVRVSIASERDRGTTTP